MAREKISFFESYHEAFKNLPPEVVGKVVIAMGSYYFDGKEIELEGLENAVFSLIKPILDSSISKAENGAKGGIQKQANIKQTSSKDLANDKQTSSKPLANIKQTSSDKDKDKDKDKEYGLGYKDKDLKEKDPPTEDRKRKPFTPPTLEEVEEFARERNSSVDPKGFFEYFDTGGWVDSKGQKVKNWKQKFLTWEKYNKGHGDNRASNNPKPGSILENLVSEIWEERTNEQNGS